MPQVQNVSLGGGQIALLSTTTILTPAQIVAMHAAPITVVPAPGAGKIIDVVSVALVYNFGTRKFLPVETNGMMHQYASDPGNSLCSLYFGLVTAAASGFQTNSAFVSTTVPIEPGADNQAVQITSDTAYNAGPIVTATLGAGGAGYVANDTGTITNGANDATYKVLTVGAGGAVLTFQITGAGTRCTVANGNATVDGGAQPGVGAGFTVNITAVNTGDGTLKVVTYYQIIPVP
jgi:hypothetical protein